MADGGKPSIRIDWFDGSLIEDTRQNPSISGFADEEQLEAQMQQKPAFNENKPIGFKRLLDISLIKPPILTLEVSHRPGFWNLFDQDELKGDFLVLIVRILANVYNDIQPGEKSKVTNLLRTRFLNSSFIEKLTIYLLGLPNVRVVEKRLNAQCWDDIEAFYFQVLDLIDGIVRFGGNCNELNNKLSELLESVEISAIGVIEEHTERLSEKLFEKIKLLKTELANNLHNWESLPIADNQPIDPNSFKNLNIFPSRQDLLIENKVYIQPNIINGAYPNVEHYLDVQFKLLREDCFGPLREGICW